MQPLYSVDLLRSPIRLPSVVIMANLSTFGGAHETRNSCRRDEENQEDPSPQEDTPLLLRFPANQLRDRNPLTMVIVSSLLAVLVLGVIIGIYLLILQSNAENVLPPVETPLQLVSRVQWNSTAGRRLLASSPMQASQVIVVQTDSEECHSTLACSSLLLNLQRNITSRYRQLPYNFLVSSDGHTYESLGWHQPSPMFPHYTGTMVLAFIGNFTEIGPTRQQMDEANNFFTESMSQRHLSPHFDIIGKNTTYKPQALFEALKPSPQWSERWSDA